MAESVQSRAVPEGKRGKDRGDLTLKPPKVSSEMREYLAAIGKIGGKKGGLAKVRKGFGSGTAAERSAVARKAARARWGKKKKAGK
jgi:hypothetical protein